MCIRDSLHPESNTLATAYHIFQCPQSTRLIRNFKNLVLVLVLKFQRPWSIYSLLVTRDPLVYFAIAFQFSKISHPLHTWTLSSHNTTHTPSQPTDWYGNVSPKQKTVSSFLQFFKQPTSAYLYIGTVCRPCMWVAAIHWIRQTTNFDRKFMSKYRPFPAENCSTNFDHNS